MQARRNILNLMSKVRSRAFLFLEKELAAAGVADLSPAHGDVLFAAARNPGSDMRQLAALTGRDKSTLTPLVERLVQCLAQRARVSQWSASWALQVPS